jgi:uncharacterized membrane protein
MNDFITGVIIGVIVQIVIATILAILYTVAIVIIMYRRARRKREETIKRLKSTIPTSMTGS